MSQRNIKILTFLGYLWVLIASLWTIYEIINESFGTTKILEAENASFWVGLSIIILSFVLAGILYKWYPSILDLFSIGKSDEDRYISLSSEDKLNHSTLLNNFNLNYLHNEMNLLEPIKDLIESEQYKRAVEYGVWASGTFLRMNNHIVRVLNGLYSLLAVEKLRNVTKSKEQAALDYISYRIKVDDLGWSLYKLSDDQVKKLKAYVHKFPQLDPTGQYSSIVNPKLFAKEQLVNIVDALEEEKRFYSVACQALRHLIGFVDNQTVTHDQALGYSEKLEQSIKNIRNRKDKKTAIAHKKYLSVKSMLELPIHTLHEFNSAKKLAEEVIKLYDSIGDTVRKVKMYQILGAIYEQYASVHSNNANHRNDFLRKAYDEYTKGIRECDEIVRFDELLDNCLSAAKCATTLGINSEPFIVKGLKIARFVKNKYMIITFEALRRPINIVLLRHGESKKNHEKIINGSGDLTDAGKATVSKRAEQIKKYLCAHQIGGKDVTIYGQSNKKQVEQSIDILLSELPLANKSEEPRLIHTDLGALSGKSEKDILGDPEYIKLERWRNKDIPISKLAIKDMEEPEDFWKRAESFVNDIKVKNEFSIIVCTTSVAILLTHILMGNKYDSEKYKCIDVPLCGMIHFKGNESGDIELNNRDNLTNVAFSELEGVM